MQHILVKMDKEVLREALDRARNLLHSPWLATVPVAALLYGSYRYLLDKRYNLPPGPTPLPFIGTFLHKAFTNNPDKFHVAMRDIGDEFGPVATIYLASQRVIVVTDVKTMGEVFSAQNRALSDRIHAYMPGFSSCDHGILFASGENWKHNRRFGMRAMREFGMGREAIVNNVYEEATPLLDDFIKYADEGKKFFPQARVTNAVCNVICALVFGHRFDSWEDPDYVALNNLVNKAVLVTLANDVSFLMFPFLRFFRKPLFVS